MFSKPNAIIYLRRSGMLVAGKRVAPARTNFSAAIVDNLEIIQTDAFIAHCQQFFNDHELHGKRVLLVLDPSVVFVKTIELSKSGKPDQLANAFIEAMPFEPGKRACVVVKDQRQLKLYATNADLYETISEALRLSGVTKILAITPAAAYPLSEGKQQLSAAIEQFVADTKVRQHANFMSLTPS